MSLASRYLICFQEYRKKPVDRNELREAITSVLKNGILIILVNQSKLLNILGKTLVLQPAALPKN